MLSFIGVLALLALWTAFVVWAVLRLRRGQSISAASVIIGPFYRTLAGHGGRDMRTLQLAIAMDNKSSADILVKYPLKDGDGQDIVDGSGAPYKPSADVFTFEDSDQLKLGLGKPENQPAPGDGVLVVGRSGVVGGGSSAIVIPAPDAGDPFRIELAAAIANSGFGPGSVMITTRPETDDEARQA